MAQNGRSEEGYGADGDGADTLKIGFWTKLETPKTHHFDYQNQKFGVDSASLRKTLGVNQLYFHYKTVSAYHPWVSVISDPPGM